MYLLSKNQLNWKSKHQWQVFEADITNIENDLKNDWDDSENQFWRSKTHWECEQCNILLCKIKNCWHLWHEKFNYY